MISKIIVSCGLSGIYYAFASLMLGAAEHPLPYTEWFSSVWYGMLFATVAAWLGSLYLVWKD